MMMLQFRNSERVHFSCRLELAHTAGGAPHAATATDLSVHGVGAVTSAVFSPGQVVTVVFHRRDAVHDDATDQVIGRIVHFSADLAANRLGIEFLSPLKETEHPQLIKKLMSL